MKRWCKHCHEEFVVRGNRHVYCSKLCCTYAQMARNPEKRLMASRLCMRRLREQRRKAGLRGEDGQPYLRKPLRKKLIALSLRYMEQYA